MLINIPSRPYIDPALKSVAPKSSVRKDVRTIDNP